MKNFVCPECRKPECFSAHFWLWILPLWCLYIGFLAGYTYAKYKFNN